MKTETLLHTIFFRFVQQRAMFSPLHIGAIGVFLHEALCVWESHFFIEQLSSETPTSNQSNQSNLGLYFLLSDTQKGWIICTYAFCAPPPSAMIPFVLKGDLFYSLKFHRQFTFELNKGTQKALNPLMEVNLLNCTIVQLYCIRLRSHCRQNRFRDWILPSKRG